MEYAYKTIEEYEKIVGYQVGEAFRIGWDMARTTNANLGIPCQISPSLQCDRADALRGTMIAPSGARMAWDEIQNAEYETPNK